MKLFRLILEGIVMYLILIAFLLVAAKLGHATTLTPEQLDDLRDAMPIKPEAASVPTIPPPPPKMKMIKPAKPVFYFPSPTPTPTVVP